MLKLAWRNLIHERTRLAISVGGVALAFVLILVIGGVFAGSEEHAVAYIRNQPIPLWLMQGGVENMHMASSILPAGMVEQVEEVEGVKAAVGLLYANAGVKLGDTVVYSYIFAVDHDVPFGGPWDLAEGKTNLDLDEVIIDRNLAARYGLRLGDQVNILGYDLTIAGLSEETFGIATSISFVNKQALALLMGVSPQAASYILVQPEPFVNLDSLATRLRKDFPEANLLTKDEFIASDKEMIRQMGADVIRAMNTIAYVVGLLVIGLTIYTATLERAREYGVMKAIGADNRRLLQLVFVQSFVSSGLGLLLGLGLAYLIASVVSRLYPEMLILIEGGYVLRQLPVLALVTAIGALTPIGRISRLDPMVVFQS